MKDKKRYHRGHRQHMHERVQNYGYESLAEHEALEYLLYLTNVQRDTNPIAHELIETFGDFAGVLEASEEELCRVNGVGPATARMLHLMPAVSSAYARSRAQREKRLTDTDKLGQYMIAQFRHKPVEQVLLLALDEQRRVRRKVWLNTGGTNQVELPVRLVVSEAVRLGTEGVVLAHNHPSGNVMPSKEDIEATNEIIRGLRAVGLRLIDHIIVTDEEYFSLRDREKLTALQNQGKRTIRLHQEKPEQPAPQHEEMPKPDRTEEKPAEKRPPAYEKPIIPISSKKQTDWRELAEPLEDDDTEGEGVF